jgi:hypothetical protein
VTALPMLIFGRADSGASMVFNGLDMSALIESSMGILG